MGRKAVVVNQKSAERITSLIKFLGLTQESFADKVGYSRQSINAFARGTRRLTSEAAERVKQCFPNIRTEWLLGYDDYMTIDDKKVADNKFTIGYSLIAQSFVGFARFNGFEFNSNEIDSKEELSNIPREMTDVPIITISCWGKKIGVCTPKEYNRLVVEVADFVDFKLKRLSEYNHY